MGLHPPTRTMRPASSHGTEVDGTPWYPCTNRGWQCNWLAAEAGEQCLSCRLTRRRPDTSDTLALEKLATTSADKRRLLIQLAELALPLTAWYEREGGLGFDLLSSRSDGERVVIGHDNGIVTIDLAETLDVHREQLRVRLGEPYRTMLGHFRHEVGHYYQGVLVERPGSAFLDECRDLFGDERTSYRDAMDRHYAQGAPAGWISSYISEYATMHPWEDFAECWAHYLHMTDTLSTAAAGSLELDLPSGPVAPRGDYSDATMRELLADWVPVSDFFNQVNRSMGKRDLYPFGIVEPVARKLEFVHRVVTASRVASPLG